MITKKRMNKKLILLSLVAELCDDVFGSDFVIGSAEPAHDEGAVPVSVVLVGLEVNVPHEVLDRNAAFPVDVHIVNAPFDRLPAEAVLQVVDPVALAVDEVGNQSGVGLLVVPRGMEGVVLVLQHREDISVLLLAG